MSRSRVFHPESKGGVAPSRSPVVPPQRKRGVALVMAMLCLAVLSILVWVFVNVSHQTLFSSRRMADEIRAFYGAEAGIRYYLSLGESWDQPLEREFALDSCIVKLRVLKGAVISTGLSGTVRKTICLTLSPDGFVLERSEL